MKSKPIIRLLKKQDLKEIISIGRQAFKNSENQDIKYYGKALWNILPKEISKPIDDFIEESIKWHCSKWPDRCYVCEIDNKVVGFALFEIDKGKKVGEISINAIEPKFRRKGYSQLLYKEIIKRLKMERMKYARVDTGLNPSSVAAQKAYEKAGFNLKAGEINYYMKI